MNHVEALLLWYFSQSTVLAMLFKVGMAVSFVFGLISLIRGVSRWT